MNSARLCLWGSMTCLLLAAPLAPARADSGLRISGDAVQERSAWPHWQARFGLATTGSAIDGGTRWQLSAGQALGDYYWSGLRPAGVSRAGGFRATSGLLAGPPLAGVGHPGAGFEPWNRPDVVAQLAPCHGCKRGVRSLVGDTLRGPRLQRSVLARRLGLYGRSWTGRCHRRPSHPPRQFAGLVAGNGRPVTRIAADARAEIRRLLHVLSRYRSGPWPWAHVRVQQSGLPYKHSFPQPLAHRP